MRCAGGKSEAIFKEHISFPFVRSRQANTKPLVAAVGKLAIASPVPGIMQKIEASGPKLSFWKDLYRGVWLDRFRSKAAVLKAIARRCERGTVNISSPGSHDKYPASLCWVRRAESQSAWLEYTVDDILFEYSRTNEITDA